MNEELLYIVVTWPRLFGITRRALYIYTYIYTCAQTLDARRRWRRREPKPSGWTRTRRLHRRPVNRGVNKVKSALCAYVIRRSCFL